MSIKGNAMIATYSVSQWTARKLDKKITEEVRTTHSASDDAGRYNKLLVAKEHTEAISKTANKARVFHYENTLPWGDQGERLLPTNNYFEYIGEMGKLKSEFDSAVSDFLSNYDRVIAEAKIRLNGMFRESDYPTRLEIEHKFGFRTSFMPVPDSDFRVGLADSEVDKLRADVEQEITNRISAAKAEIWARIKNQLSRMKERLTDNEAIFRDSLFENLGDLLDVLPRLNVTNDAEVNDVCREMKSLMVAPELVRSNPRLRLEKAQEVTALMNKFEGWF